MANFSDPRVTLIHALLQALDKKPTWLAKQLDLNHAEVSRWLDLQEGRPPKKEKYTEPDNHVYDRMIDFLESQPGSRKSIAPGQLRDFRVYAQGTPKMGVLSRLLSTMPLDFPYKGVKVIYGREVEDDFMSPALKVADIAVFEEVDAASNGEVVHIHREGVDAIVCRREIDGDAWAFPFSEDAREFSCEGWTIVGRCIGVRRPGLLGTVTYVTFTKGLLWSMKALST